MIHHICFKPKIPYDLYYIPLNARKHNLYSYTTDDDDDDDDEYQTFVFLFGAYKILFAIGYMYPF